MKALFFKISFGFYLLLLAGVLLVFDGTTLRVNRPETKGISWAPFESTTRYFQKVRLHPEVPAYKQTLVMDLTGNLFLLLPWGILAPILFTRLKTARTVCGIAFLLSLFAETTQFTLGLGVWDIDDIIYNTLGAYIGFRLFLFMRTKTP